MTTITISRRGPLVTGAGPAALERGLETLIRLVVEQGEARLSEVLRPRPAGHFLSVSEAKKGKASKGHYRRNVDSRIRGLTAVIHDSNVVYGPWLEGTSARNRTTRFKGYGSFRRTGQWLNHSMSRFIRQVEPQIVRELGGA
jgi:hypothetical protein